MPFMDDAMLDLFGEDAVGESLNTLQAQEPEQSALILRLDDLHRSGCCQRLAWSKSGAITYLSDNGRQISFRAAIRHPETAKWNLGSASPSTVTAPDGVFFTHIQWVNLSTDLVAVDQVGRLHISSLACALDRVSDHVFVGSGQADETHAVVGLHSLPVFPQQSRPPHISVGERTGDEWTNKLTMTSVEWPHHIHEGKSAFLSVSVAHVIRITYQSDSDVWLESLLPLTDPSTSYDLLTHAAFADASGFLYLATYSDWATLRLYKISIDWSQAASDGGAVQATLNAELIYIERNFLSQPTLDVNTLHLAQSLSRSKLSHLHIVPPTSSSVAEAAQFQIHATFTYIYDPRDPSNPAPSVSYVSRLAITEVEPGMLEALKSLKSAGQKTTSFEASPSVIPIGDTVIPKVILSVTPIPSDSLIAISFSDGTIEFRDQGTFESIVPDSDDSKAGSLARSGFTFLTQERCSDVVTSPDASMAVYKNGEGVLKLNIMTYLAGAVSEDVSDHSTQAMLNTLAREVSALTALQSSADEVLALLPDPTNLRHRQYLLRQVYRILQRPTDILAEDHRRLTQRVIRDALMAKAMSIQLFLGYDKIPSKLNVSGKIALITLNVKIISTALAQTVTPKDAVRVEAVITLRRSVQWMFDLLSMIADDLLTLQRNLPTPFKLADLVSAIKTTNCASLHVLLLSTPRALIRMTLELIKIYFNKSATASPQTAAQRQQFQEIANYSKSLPIRLQAMEVLLNEIDTAVRGALTAAKLTAQQRVEAEVSLLVDGGGDPFPPALEKVAEFVLTKVTTKLSDAIEAGKVMFADVAWLGLRDVGEGEGGGGVDLAAVRKRYDAVRRTALPPGASVRSCRRCGAVMEDVAWQLDWEKRRSLPQWFAQASRTCVCLGHWMVGGL